MRARSAHALGLHRRRRSRSADDYRWVVLGIGALGAGAFAALRMGLPALGPSIRDEYGLTLGQVGLAFAAVSVGVMVALVPWGLLADRVGERPVLTAGLAGTSLALLGAALAPGFATLMAGLFAAGVMGASATGASGRAIMGWFGRRERGYALGIRQMALPLGGAASALALAPLAHAHGLPAALVALSALTLAAAIAAAVWMRDAPPPPPGAPVLDSPPPMRDRRIWRLGAGSALLIVAQVAVLGFVVLFLVDERGLTPALAAAGLAAIQLSGAVGRLVAGRRSDREERRIAPIRRAALLNAALLAATAVLAGAPGALLYPVLLAAGVATMTWNGLAFTAAGEISGRARAGTAMGVQNTIIAVGGAAAPAAFGALVEVAGWPAAFATLAVMPVLAWLVLAPLEGEEDERARARSRRQARSASLSRPIPRKAKEAT